MESRSNFENLLRGARENDTRWFGAAFEGNTLRQFLDSLQGEPLDELDEEVKKTLREGAEDASHNCLYFEGYGAGKRHSPKFRYDFGKLEISDFLIGFLVFNYQAHRTVDNEYYEDGGELRQVKRVVSDACPTDREWDDALQSSNKLTT